MEQLMNMMMGVSITKMTPMYVEFMMIEISLLEPCAALVAEVLLTFV